MATVLLRGRAGPPPAPALAAPPRAALRCAAQATTNALLSHFFSLVSTLWLLRVIANRPSATSVIAKPSKT